MFDGEVFTVDAYKSILSCHEILVCYAKMTNSQSTNVHSVSSGHTGYYKVVNIWLDCTEFSSCSYPLILLFVSNGSLEVYFKICVELNVLQILIRGNNFLCSMVSCIVSDIHM